VFCEAYRDEAAHRRRLEMASYKWFRELAPELLVPGSESALPHHRQVLTPYLSE
jgi:quinol monooxygenase YgiN